jgi:peroxiredoxin
VQVGEGCAAGRAQWLARALVALIVLALVVVAAEALWRALRGPARAEVGAQAPEILLQDLGGGRVSLSQHRGRVVLLNFRTTWCGYCLQEAPELEKAHREFPSLVILAVNIQESASAVSAYARELGLTFPMLLDGSGEAARTYGVRGIPRSFFIGKDGRIAAEHLGPLTLEQIRQYLEKVGEL